MTPTVIQPFLILRKVESCQLPHHNQSHIVTSPRHPSRSLRPGHGFIPVLLHLQYFLKRSSHVSRIEHAQLYFDVVEHFLIQIREPAEGVD